MKSETKCKWVFVLAIAIRLGTKLISPVHEIMHVLLAWFQGQHVSAFYIDHVSISPITPLTYVGAYFLELGFYIFLVLFMKPRTFTFWCFGVAHALILRAPFSLDFQVSSGAPLAFLIVWGLALVVSWPIVVHKFDELEKASQ